MHNFKKGTKGRKKKKKEGKMRKGKWKGKFVRRTFIVLINVKVRNWIRYDISIMQLPSLCVLDFIKPLHIPSNENYNR